MHSLNNFCISGQLLSQSSFEMQGTIYYRNKAIPFNWVNPSAIETPPPSESIIATNVLMISMIAVCPFLLLRLGEVREAGGFQF